MQNTDNMKELFTTYVGEFLTMLTAVFGGWFYKKKKESVTNHNSSIDHGARAVNIYKEALEDLGICYEKKYKNIITLYESSEQLLRNEIMELKNKIKILRKENISLKRRIEDLKKQL